MKHRCGQFIFLILGILSAAFPSFAQGVIWSGPTITFSNAPNSDWTQPANQDRLTDQVWLTRSGANRNTSGIFNALFESGYTKFTSPAGTEWALGSLNDYATLTYTNWAFCFGGPGNLASTITSTNAVLHLINNDIYLAVQFTFYGSTGGGFSYERSTPIGTPEPAAKMIFLGGIALLLVSRKCWRHLTPARKIIRVHSSSSVV